MTEKNKLTEELMREYGLSEESKPALTANSVAVTPAASLDQNEALVENLSNNVNPFVELKKQQEAAEQKKPLKNEFERNPEITGLGAILGGMAQYKGVGQNLFSPDPNLFVATNPNTPRGQIGVAPSAIGQPLSNVEHTMQSAQGQRPGETGRQREDTHNMESNRLSLAGKENLQAPGASNVIVKAGPQYVTASGVAIPKSAAVTLEEQLLAKRKADIIADQQIRQKVAETERRFDEQKAKRANVINTVKGATQGTARMGQGIVGGAIAAPALYEYGRDVIKGDKTKPADTTQGLSGLGGLMMALGKFKGMGGLGAALQVPYVVKNRDELARSQMLSDVVPDTVRMGMTGSEMYEPANTMPVKPFPINDGRR